MTSNLVSEVNRIRARKAEQQKQALAKIQAREKAIDAEFAPFKQQHAQALQKIETELNNLIQRQPEARMALMWSPFLVQIHRYPTSPGPHHYYASCSLRVQYHVARRELVGFIFRRTEVAQPATITLEESLGWTNTFELQEGVPMTPDTYDLMLQAQREYYQRVSELQDNEKLGQLVAKLIK